MYFKRCEANGVSHHATNGYKNILKYFYEYLQYKGVSEEFYCQDFTAYTFEDFKVHIKQVRGVFRYSLHLFRHIFATLFLR